jgi:hypothetical protein
MSRNRKRKVSLSKKPQGKCVFCENTGLTKEHVFSSWLGDLLPKTANYDSYYREYDMDPITGQHLRKAVTDLKPGSLNSYRVRIVCRGCNSGWMSDVVAQGKLPSTLLIEGTATTLDRDHMTALATWVTLATMMWDCDGSDKRVVPANDFRFIMNRKTPPPSWVVFLGRYDGKTWGPIRGHRHRFTPRVQEGYLPLVIPRVKRMGFQVTTYNLSHLLVQTFCTQDQELASHFMNYPRPDSLICIWPPGLRDAKWPAGPGLDDDESQHLADGFYHAVMRAGGHPVLG